MWATPWRYSPRPRRLERSGTAAAGAHRHTRAREAFAEGAVLLVLLGVERCLAGIAVVTVHDSLAGSFRGRVLARLALLLEVVAGAPARYRRGAHQRRYCEPFLGGGFHLCAHFIRC